MPMFIATNDSNSIWSGIRAYEKQTEKETERVHYICICIAVSCGSAYLLIILWCGHKTVHVQVIYTFAAHSRCWSPFDCLKREFASSKRCLHTYSFALPLGCSLSLPLSRCDSNMRVRNLNVFRCFNCIDDAALMLKNAQNRQIFATMHHNLCILNANDEFQSYSKSNRFGLGNALTSFLKYEHFCEYLFLSIHTKTFF